ncbi:retrotransposon protein, putative, ty1-copia subclass [Tanacetum coccineum]
MKGYLYTLEHLGYLMPQELGVSLILDSLSKDYEPFVQNYNTHSMGRTIDELHAMLNLTEKWLSKKAATPTVLAIRGGKIQKDKNKPRGAKGSGKGNNKQAYAPKLKIPPPPKKENSEKDSICHHYKKDTGCGTHISNTTQGLRGSRKLKHGALNLYVGNGMRITVEAIRSFDLVLPNGLIIVLDNYHYAPCITKGVVSLSRLINSDYIHSFTNYGISVSKDKMFYFNVILWDGIYEIDMHDLVPNVSSIYNVSNKIANHVLDSTYLWNCRLGHINKKHIENLQHDGILQPNDDESFDKCKSCITGKMAHVSREVASYFITFIDDFSRYGYVYLMKPKHKVFETFKDCEALVKQDTSDKLDSRSIKCSFLGYPKETMGYYFYYPLENKIFVARNVEFLKSSLILQEASGSNVDHEIIQEENTQPFEYTSEQHNEVVHDYVKPHSEIVPNCRSNRIPQVPDRYGFYVDAEEHKLGDLNEPPNDKAALSDPEFDKWVKDMNAKMQSMKDSHVWYLVDLPPDGKTVRS